MGEPRGKQWPLCVAQVPLVSVTLPATETGRSKMAESGASERVKRAPLVFDIGLNGAHWITQLFFGQMEWSQNTVSMGISGPESKSAI